jgi:hypothetical protein
MDVVSGRFWILFERVITIFFLNFLPLEASEIAQDASCTPYGAILFGSHWVLHVDRVTAEEDANEDWVNVDFTLNYK